MRSEASSTVSETPRWPDWSGQTVVCIATGPSLTRSQLDVIRQSGVKTIGINDIGVREDWIDIWYAADYNFWKHYSNRAELVSMLKVCADDQMFKHPKIVDLYLNVLDKAKGKQFIPGYSLNGGHSGFQALCMAISFGAVRIILVGYDCKAKGHKTNFFGAKCQSLFKPSPYADWPAHYANLKAPENVEILNATPGSAITAFPMVELELCLP